MLLLKQEHHNQKVWSTQVQIYKLSALSSDLACKILKLPWVMERTGNEFCIMFPQTPQTKDDSNLLYTAQQLKNVFLPRNRKDDSINAHPQTNPSSFKNAFPCLETAMSRIMCTSYYWICGLGNTGSSLYVFLNLPHLLLNRKKSNKASLTKKKSKD